ncbi:ABC transporter, permease protein [Clostridiales bacterium oral taxon 876 str. F0540]|nr:ABC transporter, permease protein [Clostridiales bacterium oral taxon 876 str. F0540]
MFNIKSKDNGIITYSDLKKPSIRIFYYVLFAVCIIITLISIAPPVWVFLSSFKDIKEFTLEPSLIPKNFDFSRFVKTWNDLKFVKYYINSFYSVAGSVVCAIVFNGLLAYAISILKPKGSKFIYGLILGSLMVPATTSVVPLFINLSKMHLNGTFYPLWFSIGANAFYIVLYKQFFDTLPASIIEAAKIDGCNNWQIFFKIVMPLSKPITMVIAMYAVNAAWSDFLLPYLLLNNSGHETIMVRLFQFRTSIKATDVEVLRAIVFAIIPPIILFTLFQKQITQSNTHSGVKG